MNFFFPALLFLSFPLYGQFQVNGTASEYETACFSFELPNNFRSGSIMRFDSIDLREDFIVNARVFLGCGDDADDDGLVFIFQPLGTFVGSFQQRLGYKSISPSLAIEVDIHHNAEDGDPGFHHLALVANGQLNHLAPGTLAGPVPPTPAMGDLRDCQFHDLRIVWRAEGLSLAVYFDCELRLSYTGDIINNIFRGKPTVFWGFTSGSDTPGNEIRVCLDEYRLLGEMEDVTLCPGSEVRLEAPRAGRTYRWSPPEGLDDPERRNPLAQLEQTQTYRVTISDDCGRNLIDEVNIFITNANAIDLGPPDTLLCSGELLSLDASTIAGEYLWSTGARGPAITVSQPGSYSVTVTNPVCTSTDIIVVKAGTSPAQYLPADTFLCQGKTLTLAIDQPGSRIQWEDGSNQYQRTITEEGIYTVNLKNRCGVFTASTTVRALDCGKVYMPNAFSPNGDGINDHFTVLGGANRRFRAFRIFDRWGNLLFERTDALPGDDGLAWDGTFRGHPLPMGAYIYDLEMELPDGTRDRQSGMLYLLR